MVLDRDKWICQNCQLQMSPGTPKDDPKAAQVHHTRGVEFGDEMQFLVACCRSCNLAIGSPKSQDPKPRPRTKW
jgi:hypothetical protein